ncbi:hypothetical protein T265_02904 [Opisthorchis viverrini]|uniref:Uncharacterized protein n=1 Tax=Opisthorchis viverrini TaxID=6198 RepID=A0A075A597_OPIVI|nr:hypothetical protein T265_02904 [Opisthorchis viverrini]KER30760.1 hypothetical protein T265_02904 [Opisthorchis viverrini]
MTSHSHCSKTGMESLVSARPICLLALGKRSLSQRIGHHHHCQLMTSVLNTNASLPYSHDLFENLIVKKRIKVDGGGT